MPIVRGVRAGSFSAPNRNVICTEKLVCRLVCWYSPARTSDGVTSRLSGSTMRVPFWSLDSSGMWPSKTRPGSLPSLNALAMLVFTLARPT